MKNDCFAYTGRKHIPCAALNVMDCEKDKCAFYKSEEKKKADDLKTEKRLMRMRGKVNG